MYLTIVDTTQIQSYIFGSNRLRENLGASHLVTQATGQWALDAVREAASSHNVLDAAKPEFDAQRKIEADDTQQAEVIYTGGGNAVIIFREKDHVEVFTRKLSREVLEKAPGLRLVISWLEFDWRQDSLARKMKESFAELGKEKRSIRASAPLLGLGVTVECHVTALPAVEMRGIAGEEPRPVSAEIAAKLNAVVPAKERLEKVLSRLPDGYDYPDRMDHLGRSAGDQSHFAVVHADGDGMGARIESLGEKYCSPGEKDDCSTVNRQYLGALRDFSHAVNEAARDALKKTLNRLTEAIESIDGDRLITHRSARLSAVDWIPPVKLTAEKDKSGSTQYWYVPFRPVVYGGDDVTFVCDGRLGVTLANIYVEEFAKETGKHDACGGKLTACAGVAIVKAHYPFARAYQLAEDLIRSAKNYRREIIRSQDRLKDWEGACLDWHFAMSGLSGSLEEIREREYQSGKLLLRPVTLAGNPYEEHRSWQVVERILSDFQTSDQWAGKRNKTKALREKLREGEAAVREFLSLYELNELPDTGLQLTADHRERGWEQGRCLYFGAIEMADWHIPLPEESSQGKKRNGD